MTNPIKIVLADDHVLFRKGLRQILEGYSGYSVIGEANDGLELLRLLIKMEPDLVITDISMPNMRGIEALKEIKKAWPEIKVLLLTMHQDREYLYQAISSGADGYLLKSDTEEEFVRAIDTVQQGKLYVSALMNAEMLNILSMSCHGKNQESASDLTGREQQIIKLIAEGKTSKEIANLLNISSRTVQHHRYRIMKRLQIQNTADLVKYAIRKGFTSASSSEVDAKTSYPKRRLQE